MQKLFNIYYKDVGNRRLQNLLNPILTPFPGLPRNALFHYYTNDDAFDIDPSNPFFKGYQLRIQTDYANKYTVNEGNPRRNTKILAMEVKPFHVKNKLFQYRPDASSLTSNQQQLVVYSYNQLKEFYIYQKTPLVSYYKWRNVHKTIFDTIEELSKSTQRQHFITIDVPKTVPARSMLEIFKAKTNPAMLRVFDTPGKLMVLELWKWLDPEYRGKSIFSKLQVKTLAFVNILLKLPDNEYCVINLGYLNSWIKGQPNQTEFNAVTTQKYDIVQKLFLAFMMKLSSTVVEEEVVEDDGDGHKIPLTPTETQDQQEDSSSSNEFISLKKPKDDKGGELEYDDSQALSSLTIDLEKAIANVDKDLSTLEVINKKVLNQKGLKVNGSEIEDTTDDSLEDQITVEELQKQVFEDKPVEQVLLEHLDEAAEIGRISASDYRKMANHINTRKQSKDPYGSGLTIEKAAEIKPDDLVIDKERSKIATSPMVVDSSMLESSLQSMEYDYITKTYKKDVLNMIDSLQRAGVIVQKHTVEESHSALGSFEMHTLDIKPIDGQASSLRFKLPKLEDDGTYMVSSTKYKMRAQRIDVPIRKVGPDRVGLTSYYGKVFVGRSVKKSDSSLEHILRKINAATISNDEKISNIFPADVFDNNFEAPYVYNAIANHFKSFKASGYTLVFDHTERDKLFTPDQLATIEKNGSRVVGKTNQGDPIIVGLDNHFRVLKKDGVQELGDLFDLTATSRVDAPVDFAEVKVFSKSVPVGAMLAYSMGFKKLIKLLKARYRIVEGRKQKNLGPYEYAVSFSDVTYIFDRRDKVASMVLGGFQEFHKQTRLYSSKEFDQKDVYFNLFESKGLSALYIREMDLTQQLFIDPITKGILEQMGQPQTYHGLILKAVEMLDTYHHPDGQDMRYQRIRGYERFPGTIYKAMVTSIRQFKNKNISGKSRVEMSPYEVWSTIVKDPAVKMVEDINPIQNLKGTEIVTYVGEGGRAKEAMNKASRAYHVADMGIISEATVDSSDVGITAYMSANPNFKDQRGIGAHNGDIQPSRLLSTSSLLAPCADQDD